MDNEKVIIDKGSILPLYHQLKVHIESNIESGRWSPGTLIPSERELGETGNISRMTVRQAINELVNEGKLYSVRGKGTFVSRPKIEQGLSTLTSFSQDMRKRGMRPGAKMIEAFTHEAGEKIAKELDISVEDKVYDMYRLRLADDEPMALERSMIPMDLVPGIEKESMEDRSLYEILYRKYGLEFHEAKQTIQAVLLHAKEAEMLRVPMDSPAMMTERVSYLNSGRTFEYVRSYYRADRYQYSIYLNQAE
ncbi:GntR family transcriptional regulator [Salibacterium aidingense]|uniref:GntR family transcriptional regulator n=1 Tax=Salibacterium aidingense TaxID=384933 RepID=UPI003BD178B2